MVTTVDTPGGQKQFPNWPFPTPYASNDEIVAAIHELINLEGQAIDREFLITDYRVKTAFAGAQVGEWVRSIMLFDVTGAQPAQVGTTVWQNISTGQLLDAPSISNLEPLSVAGLTNAQFVAGINSVVLAVQALQTIQTPRSTVLLNAVTVPTTSGVFQAKSKNRQVQWFGRMNAGTGTAHINVLVSNFNDIATALPSGSIDVDLSTATVSDGYVIDANWPYMWVSVTILTNGATISVAIGD